jgi:hypothetical protein
VIVRSYKSAVTRAVATNGIRLWQRGYHESMLRDVSEINRARRYILSHPAVAMP